MKANPPSLVLIIDDGDTLWTKRFGGDSNDWGSDAISTSDGGYILCGYTNSFGAQNRDAWIVSLAEPNYINDTNSIIPSIFKLYQNYPNPFNPNTTIAYNLPHSGIIKLTIFDILGKNIISTGELFKSAGSHSHIFDGSNISSGIYYYRLDFDNKYSEIKKMLLIR